MKQYRTLLCAKYDSLKTGGVKIIDENSAEKLNQNGHGIFRTVNGFDRKRKIENLISINGWFTEIDKGSKIDQWQKIVSAPLEPSRVIETKRGYQIIYYAKNASHEKYKNIIKYGLLPYFDGDPNACDLARILREPGYYHLKDPHNPFLIKLLHECDAIYSETEMLKAFPLELPKQSIITTKQRKCQRPTKSQFRMTQTEALLRISGTPAVRKEIFSFYQNSNGTQQIIVNDKASSCWVDKAGYIGSRNGGGPTVVQWLAWYGNSPDEIQELLKKLQIIK